MKFVVQIKSEKGNDQKLRLCMFLSSHSALSSFGKLSRFLSVTLAAKNEIKSRAWKRESGEAPQGSRLVM